MKNFELDFIEVPEICSDNEMSEILGGNANYNNCGCDCRYNLRVKYDGKVELKTKLFAKTKKGLCFIVNVKTDKTKVQNNNPPLDTLQHPKPKINFD